MNNLNGNHSHDEIDQLTPSDEEREACAMGSAQASRTVTGDPGGILHDLSNAIGAMLMNAQVMQWKLPAYSHSKRYVREIERNAQRSAELVKQLARRLAERSNGKQETCGEVPSMTGAPSAVTAQEPNAGEDAGSAMLLAPPTHAAPDFSRPRSGCTHSVV